jgi:hypothetical protein
MVPPSRATLPQDLDEEMLHVFNPRRDSESALTLEQSRDHARLLESVLADMACSDEA